MFRSLRMKVKMPMSCYGVAETRIDVSGTCSLLLLFRDEEIELQKNEIMLKISKHLLPREITLIHLFLYLSLE